MKVKIKVHTNSSREKIEEVEEDSFEVWIKEKAIDGKANKYLEKYLGKYFGKKVVIKSGFTSRNKIVELID
jgi:uncharacterized protein (TIGR00251 family)